MVKVNAVIDELVSQADPCVMERENMVPSVKMYQLVQKLLKVNDFCGTDEFPAPAPAWQYSG